MQDPRTTRSTLLTLLALLALPWRTAASDSTVCYQIDQAHDGSLSSRYLTLPLVKKWSLDLTYAVSYPLVVNGRIWVTVGDNSGADVQLRSFDLATGKEATLPVSVKGTYWFSNACYDNNQIFVIDDTGRLSAYSSSNGAHHWTVKLPVQYLFTSAPTARNGIVYTGGAGEGGTVYAVRESDGTLLWSQSVANGDHSAPTVTSDGVYVNYVGPQAYKFDPISGTQLWHYNSGTEGGGGATTAYYNTYLYTRDWASGGNIFDAATGTLVNTFTNGPIPSFYKHLGFFQSGGTINATNLSTSGIEWSYSPSGDPFTSATINVNGVVYAGTGGGNLYALDSSTGAVKWQDYVGAPISAPDEGNVALLTGLGAGNQSLVVPAGHLLVVYGPANNAPDVTASLNIQQGAYTLNTSTGLYDQTVTLTNNTTSAIAGPMTYILDHLSGGGVKSSSGITIWAKPAHSKFFNVSLGSANSLGAGQQVSFTLHFTKTGSAISYTPRVLSGAGGR